MVQAYFEHSSPISPKDQKFSYKNVDATIVMQVIEAVVPTTAKAFIKIELLDKMGIDVYRWGNEISGIVTGAYGSSMTSRDMVKWGHLTINKGKWREEQLISEMFINKMLSKVTDSDVENNSYGYFWWLEDIKVGGKTYISKSARGGGGQYILFVEELDLVVVVTAHNKLGSDDETLSLIENRLIPAFIN
jgi:CubicO group peptidase (beta-lactamase class C family)